MPVASRPYMPDYGVPEDPDGLLSWSWAEERLVANKNYWVGTVSPEGQPHSMPVWGVWLADPDRFVFSCGDRAIKARYLDANPKAVVTVDDTVECISVQGEARRLSSEQFAAPAEVFADKYGPYMELPDKSAEEKRQEMADFVRDATAFEIRPTRAFAVIERAEEFGPKATRWTW